MGRISAIAKIPIDIQREVDATLIRNGFSHYRELSIILRERGFKISASALALYGKAQKQRLQIARAAEQLTTAGIAPDLAAELAGSATLVIVMDRRNGRARLVSMPASCAKVISYLKGMRKPTGSKEHP
ncbi:MAG: DUF3486 family protein [Betaproteobacteria bacterium]|nr:DUF3486 family protein [Betaproteobacteria bacterium]